MGQQRRGAGSGSRGAVRVGFWAQPRRRAGAATRRARPVATGPQRAGAAAGQHQRWTARGGGAAGAGQCQPGPCRGRAVARRRLGRGEPACAGLRSSPRVCGLAARVCLQSGAAGPGVLRGRGAATDGGTTGGLGGRHAKAAGVRPAAVAAAAGSAGRSGGAAGRLHPKGNAVQAPRKR